VIIKLTRSITHQLGRKFIIIIIITITIVTITTITTTKERVRYDNKERNIF